METAIGFTLISNQDEQRVAAASQALNRALAHFDDLELLEMKVGETWLQLWGRKGLEQCLHWLPDGVLFALIGSPCGDFSWLDIHEKLEGSQEEEFEPPWDGRFILLKVSTDGRRWSMWNDWIGSIPVFHSPVDKGWIASTLEPIVVTAAGFSPDDFFIPGLVSLLIHGHFMKDWTLFRDMKVLPPDCAADWDENGFHFRKLDTVIPTDDRWVAGWDELVDEMYTLSRQAIEDVLKTRSSWILPLSSGLDSRLIAAVGADLGVDLLAYTWGTANSKEVIYARQIAKALKLPWKHVDLGVDYLSKFSPLWANLFGSAMHFHGMYQIPFLESLRIEPHGSILSGYIGECLAGYDVKFLVDLHSNSKQKQITPDGYNHWCVGEIQSLMRFPVIDALDQIAEEIQNEINSMPGSLYQRLQVLTLRSRQRFFTYFQSMLCDYWRGVSTPYLNRAYARFTKSLPRAVLDDRRLQCDLFRRYYWDVAAIPGTFAPEPIIRTGRYLLKQRIFNALPHYLKSVSQEQVKSYALIHPDLQNVVNSGWEAFWPIRQVWDHLDEWFDTNKVLEKYDQARSGDLKSIRKLQSIQAVAYHMLPN